MIALFLALTAGAADTVELRNGAGSPFPIGKGRGAVGLFSPLVIGLGEKTDLTTSGWETLVAPRADIKHLVMEKGDLGLAVIGGLGVPTPGLLLIQGTVLSSDPEQVVTFATVFKAGVVGGVQKGDFTVSLGVDGRAALKLSSWSLESPGWFWLDPMLAPLTEGPVVRPRLVVDWFPVPHRFGVTMDTWVQLGGVGPDWDTRVFGQVGLGKVVSLGAGWGLAVEQFEWGGDTQALILGDVRFRW